jgi:hypothetical protein
MQWNMHHFSVKTNRIFLKLALSVMTLTIYKTQDNSTQHRVMMSVVFFIVIPDVVMQSAFILSVIVLNVAAPSL